VGAVTFTDVSAGGNGLFASSSTGGGVWLGGAASFSDTGGTFSGNRTHGLQLVDIAGAVTLVRTTADDNDGHGTGLGDGLNAAKTANAVAIGGSLTVQGARFRKTVGHHQQRGVYVQSIAGSVTFEDSTGTVQSVAVTGNETAGVVIADGGSDG